MKRLMFILAVALFAIEVFIATQLNAYLFIRAYFGDFLVVILLYCAVKSVWTVEAKRLAINVFILATLIEIAQYFQIADKLQLTGWARIVLGTSFSFHDLIMYAAGCLTAWWLDSYWLDRDKSATGAKHAQ
ncbi:MAG: hypothetical protein RI964_1507 [Pseudomonadota bacterium]|jgi:hypothetical protein